MGYIDLLTNTTSSNVTQQRDNEMIYRLGKTEKTATTTAPASPAAVAAAPAAPGPPQPLPQLLNTSKVPFPVERSQKISRPEYAKKPLFGVDAGIISLIFFEPKKRFS